ncbi:MULTISPECIES: GNAT family N-acetyltransferase [Bacillus]|uniref:N-acetyltransferase domain-containing protein n=2 Tax=Bacillus TaxID=1386 RepID=A0A0M5JJ90_9BACI|nr:MULTISPECIES: GNAT family N-acetyltransferase [Bacillus]ALC82694.1 hypothetical protein AM592_14725 [Bacillus gobiensis]MBP1081643.1 RimJ/RimL family protein N-acetyltransferase [Bacillus capparidis]MED1096297.1 GNAT family N-acetyltransferase [Bacillus capparidis]
MTNVMLDYYQLKYLPALTVYELPEEQAKYTALPANMLYSSETKSPIVILANEEVVGFFVLHTGEIVKNYTDISTAILLTSFSIDFRKQRMGFAHHGLLALNDFVKKHHSEITDVVLSVNLKNMPARRLYEQVGFLDTGKRMEGVMGEQLVLRKRIV